MYIYIAIVYIILLYSSSILVTFDLFLFKHQQNIYLRFLIFFSFFIFVFVLFPYVNPLKTTHTYIYI